MDETDKCQRKAKNRQFEHPTVQTSTEGTDPERQASA